MTRYCLVVADLFKGPPGKQAPLGDGSEDILTAPPVRQSFSRIPFSVILCSLLLMLLAGCNGAQFSATPAAPTAGISASPTSIASGGSSTLAVTATNATQVMLTGSDGSTYTLQTTGGTQIVSPIATTIYTATANGDGGKTSASVTVIVSSNPPPL